MRVLLWVCERYSPAEVCRHKWRHATSGGSDMFMLLLVVMVWLSVCKARRWSRKFKFFCSVKEAGVVSGLFSFVEPQSLACGADLQQTRSQLFARRQHTSVFSATCFSAKQKQANLTNHERGTEFICSRTDKAATLHRSRRSARQYENKPSAALLQSDSGGQAGSQGLVS